MVLSVGARNKNKTKKSKDIIQGIQTIKVFLVSGFFLIKSVTIQNEQARVSKQIRRSEKKTKVGPQTKKL